MKSVYPDSPRTLRDPKCLEERVNMIYLPHVAPLTEFVRNLPEKDFGKVPYFDPMDGGINARFLFLFEKPGRKASSTGSGFISRNNDDKTAENTFHFMQEAKINRTTTCIWNTIPGWNGKRKITNTEFEIGINSLQNLLPLLTKLVVIVLVGKKAQKAEEFIKKFKKVHFIHSYHPSPINFATAPQKLESIPNEWKKVHNWGTPESGIKK